MDTKTEQQFKIILGSSSVARKQILTEMGYDFTTMSADIDEKAIREEKPEDLVMVLAEAKAAAIMRKLQDAGTPENTTLLIAADTCMGVACYRIYAIQELETDFILSNQPDSCVVEMVICWRRDVFEAVTEYKQQIMFFLEYDLLLVETVKPKLLVGEHKEGAGPTLLITCDQVVVYEGVIREKPSSKEEARQFLNGYSGRHAATVSSVLVTNLSTGFRKGDWDKVEIYFHHIPESAIDKLIEEGIVLHVAGGLIIEHPLILPYVKEVVGFTSSHIELWFLESK
ncbi:hypothetical protein F511_01040 [Dorcoceras hygrometricum]|uniref:Maf-like protein n=1 Tax=Dorcoceras hygrometricum TaxID=472368 RepID=A0A2Z7AEN3_9LAMI|nr:hypothetical protein F511_01040 [Dorcoceras hygrometricum]